MGKAKKNVESVNNSNVSAVGVIENVTKMTASEKVKVETEQKDEIKKVLRSAAPALSSRDSGKTELINRFKSRYYREESDLSKILVGYKNSYTYDSVRDFSNFGCPASLPAAVWDSLSDNYQVSVWVSSLPQKDGFSLTQNAKSWYKEFGGLAVIDLDTFISDCNTYAQELLNILGVRPLTIDYLTYKGNLVCWSDNNMNGDSYLFSDGLYYKILDLNTANMFRALASVDVLKKWRLATALRKRDSNGLSYSSVVSYLVSAVEQWSEKNIISALEAAKKEVEQKKRKEKESIENIISLLSSERANLVSQLNKLCYLIEDSELGYLVPQIEKVGKKGAKVKKNISAKDSKIKSLRRRENKLMEQISDFDSRIWRKENKLKELAK